MRVIAGSVKGRKLKAPAGLHTRPITDMIKEALFNVWGPAIHDAAVLDLFAGSGSVGIEALSRGAEKSVFVDNDLHAVRIIKENLDVCGFATGYEIMRNDVFKVLENLHRHGQQFDLIYVDPPFSNEKIFHKVMTVLGESNVLKEDGILVIRTKKQKELADRFDHLERYRKNTYGESTLHYYCMTKEDSIL